MTSTLQIWQSDQCDLADFAQGLAFMQAQGQRSVVILAADLQVSAAQLAPVLKQSPLIIGGGVFAQLIFQHKTLTRGVIMLGFDTQLNIQEFNHLSEHSAHLHDIIRNQPQITQHQHFLLLTDALCGQTENFIHALYEYLGNGITVIGGGAGTLDFIQKPCIFTHDGLKQDVAQLIAFPSSLRRGVSHGWQILAGPFLVSESQGTWVQSLNYQSAFSLYREIIEQLSDYRFHDMPFFDIAKNFPFGIEGIDGQLLVRDPILQQDNALMCVGNVPSQSMLYILQGDTDQLINSAGEAAQQSQPNATPPHYQTTLIFDCISRVLYLGEQFEQELAAICRHTPQSVYHVGALSLGEITHSSAGALTLLNKSTVVGSF